MDAAEHRGLLGEVLVREGLLTEEQLAAALGEQERTGERLGAILVSSGLLSGPDLAMALADQHGSAVRTEHGWATGWATARAGALHANDALEPGPAAGVPDLPARAVATVSRLPDASRAGVPDLAPRGGATVSQLPVAAGLAEELHERRGSAAALAEAHAPSVAPTPAPALDALAAAVDAKRQELDALNVELERAKAELAAVASDDGVDEPDAQDFVVIGVVDGRYVLHLGRGEPPAVGSALRLPDSPDATFVVARDRRRHCVYVQQAPAAAS